MRHVIVKEYRNLLRAMCIAGFGREGHMASKCRSMSLLLPRVLAHTLMIA